MVLVIMNKLTTGSNPTECRPVFGWILTATFLLLAGCGGGGGGGGSNSGPANTRPVALDGFATTNQDTTSRTLKLKARDSDGDRLKYKIESNGILGTAKITDTTSGAYTYTPAPGQFGSDTFTFSVSDSKSTSNTATVSVEINGAPLTTGACNTVRQGNQAPGLVGRLAGTDPETPNMLIFNLLNPDGSDAGLTLTTKKGGTVTITDQTAGDFTYMADVSPGDKRGRDSFDYQVSDPDGASTNATETVIVDQRIMPLGDSITLGSNCTGGTKPDGICITGGFEPNSQRTGYRQPLSNKLTAAGFSYNLVGSRQAGSKASPPLNDDDHEGHGGWTAFELAWGRAMDGTDGIFSWLERNPADFILLHAGTNDLVNTDERDLEDILDEIDRWENSANGNPVTVVLAKIIDRVPNEPKVSSLNNAVAAMVSGRSNDNIIVVDQQTGAGINYAIGADMSDWLHPDDSGYRKMANVWFNSLDLLLDKCP